jgi:hypothetical protein
MPAESLNRRDEHVGRTFTAPHNELYRAMHGFLKDLAEAEESYRQEVAEIRSKLRIAAEYSETPDVERYSLAIQVFAAMIIEAAISFYAVLRFGGEKHDDHFRWGSADKRLRAALRHAGADLQDDAEILRLVRSVMDGRHTIVHPFSAEFLGDEQARRFKLRTDPSPTPVRKRRETRSRTSTGSSSCCVNWMNRIATISSCSERGLRVAGRG